MTIARTDRRNAQDRQTLYIILTSDDDYTRLNVSRYLFAMINKIWIGLISLEKNVISIRKLNDIRARNF